MVEPHRKFTPEEIAANAQATVERELKQEGISQFEARRNRGSERNHTDNDDDEISVVSATTRPKELQGHNAFDEAKHWATPKRHRRRKKPAIFVSNMNNVGSPTSSIDSPLAATQRQTHTSNITNNDSDSENDNDVVEKPLIGSRVAVLRESAIHFGTIISCAMLEGRNHYCIEYDDRIIVEVNTIELSRLQQLYIEEMNNDTIG